MGCLQHLDSHACQHLALTARTVRLDELKQHVAQKNGTTSESHQHQGSTDDIAHFAVPQQVCKKKQ